MGFLKEDEILEWNESTEIKLISQCQLGIMPLDDTIWSRSKCGFKLIQYMSYGLPVIASPVGVNKKIVIDGYNGYLCAKEDEWISKIEYLIKNQNQLSILGKNAKKHIYDNYDLDVWKNKFIDEIRFF